MLPRLPRELLEQILLQLDPLSVKACALLSREFITIIRSSLALRYLLACHTAGVVDNPRCKLSYAERYEALRKREKGWCGLQPTFTQTFDIKYGPSFKHDLTAGIYLHAHVDYRDLHYCALPSTPNDVPRWSAINAFGPSSNKDEELEIVDVGMAVYEHDLLASVISRNNDNWRYTLEIILLQFSTGKYHPMAQSSRIFVQHSYESRPDIALEIVGDNLALVFEYCDIVGRLRNRLFIFDWKTGHRKLYCELKTKTYTSLFFLSPEILIVPNDNCQYGVWKIPKEADSVPHQILSLCFPALSRGHSIVSLRCRGGPNPYLHDIPHAPPRPFHTSADNTIMITIICIREPSATRDQIATLVMHRHALLETITNRLPEWHASYSIPWSEWGPPISRWFVDDDLWLARWLPVSAGQRWAVLNPADDGNYRISIIDFNPYNMHKVPSDLRGKLVVEQPETLLSCSIFAEDIEMGLGYTIYTAPEVYDFDGLLMEEERLVGLKDCDKMKMTVFHFG